jgi:dihydrofolate reductase
MSGGRADAAAPSIGLIWAQAAGGVIGRDGGMPWHVPEDLAHFKAVTLGAPVIMGRKTWDSLSPRFRPLPGRRNIVVTRQHDWSADGAEVARSVDDALALAELGDADRVWVIGGAQIFTSVLDRADVVELTEIDVPVDGDTFAPALDSAVWHETVADPPVGWHTSRTGLRFRWRRLERS